MVRPSEIGAASRALTSTPGAAIPRAINPAMLRIKEVSFMIAGSRCMLCLECALLLKRIGRRIGWCCGMEALWRVDSPI